MGFEFKFFFFKKKKKGNCLCLEYVFLMFCVCKGISGGIQEYNYNLYFKNAILHLHFLSA
jgi:hypothetical protein